MRMPSHTALCSFIFSTILTSAFVPSNGDVALASAGAPGVQLAVQSALTGVRTQVFAGGAEVALPTPASTPAAAPATVSSPSPEFMSKMIQLITARGVDKEINA